MAGKPKSKDWLPNEMRRKDGKLIVNFHARFPDGTAFRRMKEFDEGAMRSATTFLERAKAEFARGNGVGAPVEGQLTVGTWCDYCLDVAMPAQKNDLRPKYSDETLAGFREVVSSTIKPAIGQVPLEELKKATITNFVGALDVENSSKTLNVLTRMMELAESKGKRKKGTNPCKGIKPKPN